MSIKIVTFEPEHHLPQDVTNREVITITEMALRGSDLKLGEIYKMFTVSQFNTLCKAQPQLS